VHRKAAAAAKWRPASHLDDVVGPRERQRPQQQRVHNGKDRRVGADSQPEDEGGCQDKDWCPPQRADGEMQISQKAVEDAPRVLIANRLFHLSDASELEGGSPSRLFRRDVAARSWPPC